MGACLSGSRGHLQNVDDSVHVMLGRDRKKRRESGQAATATYKPRASNPALEEKAKKVENEREEGEEKTEETAYGNE